MGNKVMMDSRIIYEEVNGCEGCLHNRNGMCYKLSQPISRVRFDEDCPLPTLTDVEKYLRYITKDGKLDCCGNCRNWKIYML